MRTLRTIAILGWIGMTASCVPGPANDSTSQPTPDPSGMPSKANELSGTYDYRGEAEQGEITGTLTLQFVPVAASEDAPMRVAGTWELAAEGVVAEIGPQTGTGQLEGEFHPDGTIRLALNPGMFDNNVNLAGTLDPSGRSFSGSWEYSNFTGVVTGGSFDAEKR